MKHRTARSRSEIKVLLALLLAVSINPLFVHASDDDGTPSFVRNAAGIGRIVDPSSGTYTGAYLYKVPINVPPGRNGMTPELSLNYSSQRHRDTDYFGYGWDISIPYIERFNKSGVENLYSSSSPSFYSSIDGELYSNVQATGTIEYLVVAGGGSGGGNGGGSYKSAGGGGAGGVRTGSGFPIPAGVYTITVGAGGSIASVANGQDSSIGSLIVSTGGGAGGNYNTNGSSGGSGGGGGVGYKGAVRTGGSGIAAQGNNGGTSADAAGAGGGGAGGVGGNTSSPNGGTGGNGGIGIASSISGTTVWYGGGGGGGASSNPGQGGMGGGGAGSTLNASESGAPNTGGGGGGNDSSSSGGSPGTGGSGIVIIRYHSDGSDGFDPASTGGGTVTTSGDYTIHTFTSSGTFTATSSFPQDLQSDTWIPRIDNGSFNRYNLVNDGSGAYWVMTDKSGKTYVFGSSAAARQDDPSNSAKVYKWMLQKVTDPNGNTITYTYSKDSGQIYPDSITYTGSVASGGIFSVNFTKSLMATSTATTTDTGFAVKTKYKIDKISASVNGDVVHTYDLSYGIGDNKSRMVLSSVTETGQIEGSATTLALPPTTFTYSVSSSTWATTTWSQPIGTDAFVSAAWDRGVNVTDVNGDGLADEVQAYHAYNQTAGVYDTYDHVYINTGTGWTVDSNWSIPCTFTTVGPNDHLYDGGGRLVDVNGDLLPDFICNNSTYINTGSTWTSSNSWNLPVNILYSSNYDNGVRFGDVNGDGLVDIVQSFDTINPFVGTHTYQQGVYLNKGNGWTLSSSWTLPNTSMLFANSNHTLYPVGLMADINGDGLADLVNGNDVYMNSGSAWVLDAAWSTPVLTGTMSGRLADINGDGLVDLLDASALYGPWPNPPVLSWSSNYVYLNTGSGWVRDYSRVIPAPFQENTQDTGSRFADMNGDGVTDIIVDGAGMIPNNYAWSQNSQFVSQANPPDILTGIVESVGATLAIAYKGSAQYRDASSTLLNPTLPASITTLQSVSRYDGLSTTTTETYQYKGGANSYRNPFIRRIAGFNSILKTDTAGNVLISYFHQGNGNATSSSEQDDRDSKIGKSYRSESYDSTGNLYSLIINKWNSFNRGGPANFVYLATSTELDYDGNASHRDRAVEYTYATTTGNPTRITNWGEVTASTTGQFTDIGTDKLVRDLSYAASTTGYFILPAVDTLVDQIGNKIKEVRHYYDSLSLGSLVKGNETKLEQWKSGVSTPVYVSTQNAFNAFGLIASTTDARGKVTTYTYDTHNLYPATTTNPLGQVTAYTRDYSSGKVKQTKDANGLVHETIFDALDRVLQQNEPDLVASSTLVTKTAYAYTDSTMPRKVQQTNYLDATTTVTNLTYLDGLGRAIQQRKQSETEGTYIVTDAIYGNRGLLVSESLPYFSAGTTSTAAASSSALFKTYTYDPLNRVKSIVNAVGSTSYAYDDWTATTTDPLGHVKGLAKDAYGNLVRVTEANAGNLYKTNYEWNGLGRLTKITDANGNLRNLTYDGLGRSLTAEDLHAPSDATFGTWSYDYDDAGNMTQSVSPRSLTTTYTYDDINRVLTENSTATPYTDVTYQYDTSAHYGIGRLANVSTAYIGTAYDYDANGNLATQQQLIPGLATTTMWFSYDRQGNPTYTTYPDGATLYYGYNGAGLLEYVAEQEVGGGWTYPANNFDYAPTNQVTLAQLGNATNIQNTYDADHLYRLSLREAWNSNTYFQYLPYTYDAVGNITAITDSAAGDLSGKSISYGYDDLNRLVSASTTAVRTGQNYSRTFTYDPVGNLLTSPGVSYLYDGTGSGNYANPHAPTSVGSTTYTYDADGNLLSNGVLTNQWDYKDRLMQSVSTLGSTTTTSTYTYDHAGQRITQTVNGVTTFYPNKYYSVSGSTKDKYIYANGQLLAIIETVGSTTAMHYVYADPLGSSNVVASAAGVPEQFIDYYPYGGIRVNTATSSFDAPRKYIGQFTDSATALNYLNARYQDGARGQFLSEDPVFWSQNQNLSDPQSLNSYSYANDNPITKSDPNGLAASDPATKATQAVIQNQINQIKAQVQTLWANITVNAPRAAVNGLWNTGGAYSTVMDPSSPISVKIGAGAGGIVGIGATLFVPETRAIGATGKVGEAALNALVGGDSQVLFKTSIGTRVVDQLANGVANEAKTGYQALTARNASQIAKDQALVNDPASGISSAAWHFFTSPVTGMGGPSAPLQNALIQAGINIFMH